jgi:hypothetical protein
MDIACSSVPSSPVPEEDDSDAADDAADVDLLDDDAALDVLVADAELLEDAELQPAKADNISARTSIVLRKRLFIFVSSNYIY